MRDELAEVESHVGSGVTQAHRAAIPLALHGDAQAPGVPGAGVGGARGTGRGEFVQRHRHRAEGGGRLALQKAEVFGQFIRHQVAQAPVVGEHDEANAVQRALR